MALDKLVDSAQLDSDLTSVANAIRAKSGGSASLAFPAGFVSEIGSIPSGGLAPPVNAVAQFPIGITFASRPGSISIDFTSIIGKLTNNRTYSWSFILWRDDIVSSTSLKYIASNILAEGRISPGTFGTGLLYSNQTMSSSLTSGVHWWSSNLLGSSAFSSNVATITLKDNTDLSKTDLTGKWRGVFTVMPPWTDEYTGTKVTTCPTGFISYTPYS